jgi:hypothetical protein
MAEYRPSHGEVAPANLILLQPFALFQPSVLLEIKAAMGSKQFEKLLVSFKTGRKVTPVLQRRVWSSFQVLG